MSYLGRKGAVAPLTSADIPAGIVEGTDIAFLENASGTQNLGGTYSTERMYLNDSYTLTGDVTITGHLALGTIADSDVIITQDGTERTITGSGTLDGGNVLQDTHRTSVTGMTGELGTGVTLGSAVTGSPNLNLGNATFPAFAKSFFVKGWVTFNQSSNTILSSYNVSSISHPATGRTIINWDTDFGSANYAISGMASDSSNPLIMTLYNASGAITSSSVQIMVQYQNFNLADGTFVSVMAIGD